jgi:Ran GTPase-activating protein (RanGAP) involved in mRNA processing and transport
LVNNLKENKSEFDITVAGIKLISVQIRALVSTVGKNQTLKCLSLNRKGITDVDGADMIRSLMRNDVLEKIELEGNNLGPATAKAMAQLLRNNRTLKHVNIENNDLTQNEQDTSGVRALADVSRGRV